MMQGFLISLLLVQGNGLIQLLGIDGRRELVLFLLVHSGIAVKNEIVLASPVFSEDIC